MQLRTPRLLLRDFRPSDIADLSAYHTDPRYLEHYEAQPDAERIVRLSIAWAKEHPRLNDQLAIAESETAPAIGSVGLRGRDQTLGMSEFGFELNPVYWGRGYARETGEALLDFGFRALKLEQVFSPTAVSNGRAHRLLESLGFIRVPRPSSAGIVWFYLSSSDGTVPDNG